MADISKITLPSGNTYNIKDATAREDIANLKSAQTNGVNVVGTTETPIADGESTPTVVTINGAEYTVKQNDLVQYDNGTNTVAYVWTGTQWDQWGTSGAFKALAYKDSVTGTVKPTGTVTAPQFTGSEGKVTVTGTASGTVSTPTFTGNTLTSTGNVKPEGIVGISVADPMSGETANYTPTGSVSVTPSTETIGQITDVGKLPAWSASVANENLTFSFDAGSLPTKSDTTVANGVKTATFTGNGAMITGSFTGNDTEVSVSGTPSGKVSTPTFTGGTVTSTGNFTPAGTNSIPSFTGDSITVESK